MSYTCSLTLEDMESGPPCLKCVYWRPIKEHIIVPKYGLMENGFRCCHHPFQMEFDFSCFYPKEEEDNVQQTV